MSLSEHEKQIIEKVHNFISNNYKKHILIAHLVRDYGISESTLTKGFKFLYNKTIYRFRLEKSMQYAKSQREEGVQIKNIKKELGYKTTGSFARAYRKIYGGAPTKSL
jgi:AraC-like DNA-binding protein